MLPVLAVILLLAASLSSVSTRGLKVILLMSGAFLFVAGVSVSIALLVVAPTLQPVDWAVKEYNTDDMVEGGLPNLSYMFLIGSLMGQATFIGACLACSTVPYRTSCNGVALVMPSILCICPCMACRLQCMGMARAQVDELPNLVFRIQCPGLRHQTLNGLGFVADVGAGCRV